MFSEHNNIRHFDVDSESSDSRVEAQANPIKRSASETARVSLEGTVKSNALRRTKSAVGSAADTHSNTVNRSNSVISLGARSDKSISRTSFDGDWRTSKHYTWADDDL